MNTPHFASGVQFLGGKLRCLLSARMRGNDSGSAFNMQQLCNSPVELTAVFPRRNGVRLPVSCSIHVRIYRNDCKCISVAIRFAFLEACSSGIGRGRRATEEGRIKAARCGRSVG